MRSIPFIISVVASLFVIGCSTGSDHRNGPVARLINDTVNIHYSSHFKLFETEQGILASVTSPWPGSVDTLNYLIGGSNLVAANPLKGLPSTTLINGPLNKVICFSTSHIPILDMLGIAELLVGFPTTDYISNEHVRKRIREGSVADLGPSNDVNIETILSIDPDIIFAFSMGNDQSIFDKISLAGMPVVFVADYLEEHPLGRAEWIRFFAAFFNKLPEGDSIFNGIAHSYQHTRQVVGNTDKKPTVFTGVVYGDTWFMPGGRNYGARFFDDAGGRYIWADDPSGSNIQLSFESVFDKARNADYWIGTATYDNLEQLYQADMRYGEFSAFEKGNVYNYTARIGAAGGNDYFETGYARPDLILQDLAKIFHPEIMRDHAFYFFKKLN